MMVLELVIQVCHNESVCHAAACFQSLFLSRLALSPLGRRMGVVGFQEEREREKNVSVGAVLLSPGFV